MVHLTPARQAYLEVYITAYLYVFLVAIVAKNESFIFISDLPYKFIGIGREVLKKAEEKLPFLLLQGFHFQCFFIAHTFYTTRRHTICI